MNEIRLSGYTNYIKHSKFRKYLLYSIAVLLLSFTTIIALSPEFAFAGILEDALGSINRFMMNMTNGMFEGMWANVKHIMDGGLLTADFDHLFGSNQAAVDIYNVVQTICDTVVKPIAGSILALVFLLQFIKMAGKADSNGTIPMFKEILVMFLFFVLFEFAVSHADDICAGIYSLFTEIAKKIAETSPTTFEIDTFIIAKDGASWDDNNYMATLDCGACLYFIIIFFFGSIATFLASIIATVMCYARAIQLYAYTTFAPIPLSMLGFEETRSWGVGFFKNFAAVALAGVILVFILFIFPTAIKAIMGSDHMSAQITTEYFEKNTEGMGPIEYFLQSATGMGESTGNFFKTFGFLICFIIAMVKSGGWAKDILGS